MTDIALQKKLDQFVRLGNTLDREAKRRFGDKGFLFHEADGGVYIMNGDGDSNARAEKRQEHIVLSTTGSARWGAGAW